MLTELTPEQEAMLPSFVEYAKRIGLSTERTDRDAANAAINAHYEACGLPLPKEIRWFDSPYASVGASVRDSVRASVWASVWDSVWASVGASVGDSVGDSVRISVGDSVRISVRDSVGASVRASVRASVWASVGASVWDSVGASVWDSVWASVGAHYDADDAAWILAWDSYGVSLPKSALTFMAVSEIVWWWYPGEDVVFASDRPTAIHLDDAGRLHSEGGMALEFADGQGLSAWHGQTIPDKWVAGSPPSPKEALHWQNMDQRAAACEIVGWHNLRQYCDARTIDKDSDPMWGELVEMDLPDSPNERFLFALCGTGRQFALPVPPETASVDQAQSVLHGGLPVEILKNYEVRT